MRWVRGEWAQTRLEGSGLAPMRTPFSAAACQEEGLSGVSRTKKGLVLALAGWRNGGATLTRCRVERDRCQTWGFLGGDGRDCPLNANTRSVTIAPSTQRLETLRRMETRRASQTDGWGRSSG